MRPYPGISPQTEEDPVRRQKWTKLDWFLRDLEKGLGRIQNGLKPDGSGTPIIDAALSDIYLVLKGRPGNQVAHGGTFAGGKLTLSSTLHPTKGLIYLGESEGSAWDETNSRLGVGTTAATAKVHIKVGATSNQGTVPSTVTSGGGDWGTTGSMPSGLSDNSDATFIARTGGLGFATTTTLDFDNVTRGIVDPGAGHRTGYQIVFRAKTTQSANNGAILLTMRCGSTTIFANKHGLGSQNVALSSTIDLNLTGSFAAATITLTDAECALMTSSGQFGAQWHLDLSYSGGATNTGDIFTISEVSMSIPPLGGLGGGDTLQKWEDPTTSHTLVYTTDGNSHDTLALLGGYVAVSASGFAITTGSMASGMVAASKDAIGTVQWASASSLATKVQHRFVANGYYRTDTHVDGAWIASGAMTLGKVLLYRRQGGSAGSTTVDLMKNGTSVLSSAPAIAFNAGASATASGTITTTAIAAGDRFTVNATADTGRPQDWMLEIEAY